MLSETVACLGLLGFLLAVIGLYGLMSYLVSRRRREIGIRMAIGADRGSVLRMVIRQGFQLGFAAVALGTLVGILVCRGITSMLIFSFDRIG
jgi:ABC-type antimicrobial peptide transport system permease subunit